MKSILAMVLFAVVGQLAAQTSEPATVSPYLWSPERPKSELGEINANRRFSSERTAAMREFYGEVLALQVLPDTAVGGGRMIRYPVGSSEVKLFPEAPSPANADANTASVSETAGVRLLTFFYPDQAALVERFKTHGLPVPSFAKTSRAGASAAALVQDPDGQWVELVVVPGATPAALARFEIGITVNDLEASRAFYGNLMGLKPQPPVRDELVGGIRYPFTHGATTINLWSFGTALPKDLASSTIQYIVWNVAAIDEVVRARGATIDRPLSQPGQMRTLFLLDPDGISNYFAEYSGNDNRPVGN
jgi:catechol 2,3-dioxygenase-like lactoylglutathione lyase family enzyme